MPIGVVSYGAAALSFFLFAILLLTRWRGHLQGRLFFLAIVVSVLWSLSGVATSLGAPLLFVIVAENLRNLLWLMFLLHLIRPLKPPAFLSWFVPALVAVTLVVDLFPFTVRFGEYIFRGTTLTILGHLLQALTGLSLIEQLFRHTPENRRWSVKHLYLGLGCVFAYDFYLYADTLLFKQTDLALWQARGFVNVIAIPLLAISTARNLPTAILFAVSHTAAFNMTAIFVASIYLLFTAAAGYYVRAFEGSWGTAFQVLFFLLAVLLLLVVIASHRFRARLKVLISKHFLDYKYDYRNEWMNLLDNLSTDDSDTTPRAEVIQAIARIVTAESGMLWMRRQADEFQCIECWNETRIDAMERAGNSLPTFLMNKRYLINLHEYNTDAMHYAELELPEWISSIDNPWLIIPLLQRDQLTGFIVLGKPMVKREINWEDRDFLIAAGHHIAGHLALLEASEALTEARQFEAFNRLSAYVVHDLKNVIAQLELIISNAERHKDNPEFIDDAFATVGSAAEKMHRMLSHLRQERVAAEHKEIIDLEELLRDIARQRSVARPVPEISSAAEPLLVMADRDRIEAVLTHLVENAQDATASDGYVKVLLRADAHRSVIEIVDNGCGMDAAFIRDRLFKPFDTTKGNAGMGIGAYEGREFIRTLGGTVKVSSAPGEGTTFTICLPQADAATRVVDAVAAN